MAEAFVELGATGIDWVTDKYWDRAYDTTTKRFPGKTKKAQQDQQQLQTRSPHDPRPHSPGRKREKTRRPSPQRDPYPPPPRDNENHRPAIELRDNDPPDGHDRRDTDRLVELESQNSERVLRAYESERDDPRRPPESVLSTKDLQRLRRDSKMSHANGYAPSYGGGGGGGGGYGYERPRSAGPTKSRAGYYDDEYESDYDDRSGRRHRASGARGYDDRYDDERPYDREIIETERYRGPARTHDPRRLDAGAPASSRDRDPYGAGAVTQYRRNDHDLADYRSRRSSRVRRDRSRSRSSSRSRSRSRSRDGVKGKLDDHFDTTWQGLGAGIAGAALGGYAAKEFGDRKHRNRDMILGALVGGLGANAAENKWRDWRDEREEREERREGGGRYEKGYGGEYGRSRSAMR